LQRFFVGEQYYQDNKGRIMDRSRNRYGENKESILQQQKEYYKQNRGKQLERAQEYRNNHRAAIKDYKRTHYKNNREDYYAWGMNRKNRLKNAKGFFTAKQWFDKLEYYGYRCYLCRISLENQETHKDHRTPISRGGSNWIANIAPACAPCNLSKNAKTEKEFREWKKA
jgi:5-methylcytosine-specific restriction endonuclease McrA